MPLWTLTEPPHWAPNAVATPAGWVDPDTNELLITIDGLSTFKHGGSHHASASVTGSKNGPFTITTGVNDAISLSIDGNPPFTFQLYNPNDSNTTFSLQTSDVVSQIQDEVSYSSIDGGQFFGGTFASASTANAPLVIASPITGAASNITLNTIANSAYSTLGLSVGSVHGTSSGVSSTTLGANIVGFSFDKDAYSVGSNANIALTFDKQVSWTGNPQLVFSAGGTVFHAFAGTLSPATTILFQMYLSNAFSTGTLNWGNPITSANGQYGDILVTAVTPGTAGNSIQVGIGAQMQGATSPGIAVTNATADIVVDGNLIMLYGATDSSGVPTSTIQDFIDLIAGNSTAAGMISLSTTVPLSTVVPTYNAGYSSGVVDANSPSGFSSAGGGSSLGGGLASFNGQSITAYTGSLAVTYTDASGSPSLAFNTPLPDLTPIHAS